MPRSRVVMLILMNCLAVLKSGDHIFVEDRYDVLCL